MCVLNSLNHFFRLFVYNVANDYSNDYFGHSLQNIAPSIARNLKHKTDPPIGQIRWNETLGNAEDVDWEYSYKLPFTCKLNANIRYFQYQILHRSLITNRTLYQFQLLDHETCDQCNEIETIGHLIYECNPIRNLWTEVLNWLSRRTGKRIEICLENVLMGNKKYNYCINYVMIVTKNEIYKQRWINRTPSLIEIKYKLKKYMETDIYIGTTTDTLEKTLGKWSPIYNELRRL